MAPTIKNQAACRLIGELAKLTGETMTQAVTAAVSERLERVQSGREGRLAERLVQIGKEGAARLKEPHGSIEHGELLYPEEG